MFGEKFANMMTWVEGKKRVRLSYFVDVILPFFKSSAKEYTLLSVFSFSFSSAVLDRSRTDHNIGRILAKDVHHVDLLAWSQDHRLHHATKIARHPRFAHVALAVPYPVDCSGIRSHMCTTSP
jgi:hypothetical protein